DEFLHFDWRDSAGGHAGENDYLLRRPKDYRFATPRIEVTGTEDQVTLTSDLPALYVTYDHGGSDVWSDNAVTLLPGVPKHLTLSRARGGIRGDGRVRYLQG
ncbi:hypothetical protein LL06_19600, partial [Hoeflea sp. BAL378]|uniref:glycoside hydrolase family 2 protein n=1 Tax=Hoeflea sp. BAL378 TaxID=1547437 RepID=UPI0005135521